MLDPIGLRRSTSSLSVQLDRLERQNNKNNETNPNDRQVVDEAFDIIDHLPTEPDNQLDLPWLEEEDLATLNRIIDRVDAAMR